MLLKRAGKDQLPYYLTQYLTGISEIERIKRSRRNVITSKIHFAAWIIDVSFYREVKNVELPHYGKVRKAIIFAQS